MLMGKFWGDDAEPVRVRSKTGAGNRNRANRVCAGRVGHEGQKWRVLGGAATSCRPVQPTACPNNQFSQRTNWC